MSSIYIMHSMKDPVVMNLLISFILPVFIFLKFSDVLANMRQYPSIENEMDISNSLKF